MLHWQGDGFAFFQRLEKGTFEIPKQSSSQNAMEISPSTSIYSRRNCTFIC
ncbi:MAG: hypothetical protein IPI23_21215 [Bacteroidetes bacterium]|nr:hypothetical protein [Bacteroidota bacterium]